MIPLQAGDTVALVCTGSVCRNEQEVIKTADYLKEQYDLNCIYDEHCYRWQPTKQRAKILMDYVYDPEVRLIWSLRGGEGSADVLEYIDSYRKDIEKIRPKYLLGFSDFTAILFYFFKFYAWPVIHGHGALQLAHSKATLDSEQATMDLLFTKRDVISFTEISSLNEAAYATTHCESHIIAANLTLLTFSVQDIWQLCLTNKIVLLEDVNEKGYALQRSLKYLHRIDVLKDVSALILGDFNGSAIGCTQEEQKLNKQHIQRNLEYFAESCPFPVYQTKLFGHGENNFPLMFDQQGTLSKQGNRYLLSINIE